MGRFLLLQCKRVSRILPGVLCAALVLVGALSVLFSAVLGQNSDAMTKVKVGIVGTADDPILAMGQDVLQTADDSRYSMEIQSFTESQAQAALENGEVDAYVVIPENFMEEANRGNFIPLKYVGTVGSSSLVSMFKDEFTRVIGDILLESRKGVYGFADAMEHKPGTGTHMNQLALTYVEYVVLRSGMYSMQELGIADSLGLDKYLLCGLLVLLITLICLPFAPLMIKNDYSLTRLLKSRGISLIGQTLCEFAAYFVGMLVLSGILAIPVRLLIAEDILGELSLVHFIPAVFALTAISFFLYQLTADLISGVLLQFFAFLALTFVSGCMYPVFFFPQSIQILAGYLPTGLARSFLAAGVTGDAASSLWLWAYGAAGLLAAVGVRKLQLRRAGR